MSHHAFGSGAVRAGGEPPTCGLSYVRQRLGSTRHGKRLRSYVDGLIRERGFPPPFPSMQGRALVDGVTDESKWDRAPVDRWFADRVPDALADSIDRAEADAAATDMDDRATRLGAMG